MNKRDRNTIAEESEGQLPYIEQVHEAGWRKTFAGKKTLHPAVPHLGKVRYTIALPELPRHQHLDCLEIHGIQHGQLHWELKGLEYSLKAGDCFFILPGEPHGGLRSFMEPCRHFFLQIHAPTGRKDPVLRRLLAGLTRLPTRQFRGNKIIQNRFDQIFRECERPQKHSSTAQRCNLVLFLIDFLRLGTCNTEVSARPAFSAPIRRTLDHVRKNIENPATVEEMRRASGLCRSEFFRRFQEETGASPNQYLLWERLETAKKLLLHKGTHVTDVAHRLGFGSSQYFATVFRRHTGLSPNEFRHRATATQ